MLPLPDTLIWGALALATLFCLARQRRPGFLLLGVALLLALWLARITPTALLVTLAAQLRYGVITQADFDQFAAGRIPAGSNASPQPVGQAADVGSHAGLPESGPALLADFTGGGANAAAPGHGA